MKYRWFVLCLVSVMMAVAACGGDDEGDSDANSDAGANESAPAAQTSSDDEPELEPGVDYTFTITFSTGEEMATPDGEAEFLEARTNFGRAESGGIDFDATVFRRSGEENVLTGNSLRFYLVEDVTIGEVALAEMVGQVVLAGETAETDQRVDCDHVDDGTVTITALGDGRISGSFTDIVLSECRDAWVGGLPIEGASVTVSGEFENVPFTPEDG